VNITIRIEIGIDRADGSHTTAVEEYTRHAGDNPRLERDEIGAAIVPAVDKIIAHFPAPGTTNG
jgi:hypothetical protein